MCITYIYFVFLFFLFFTEQESNVRSAMSKDFEHMKLGIV